MKIEHKYPNLTNFLIAYIAEADYEGFSSDYEAVQSFTAKEFESARAEILEEGKALLAEPSFPWEEISYAANRYVESLEPTQQWFEEIIKLLEFSENNSPDTFLAKR